jgi:uncharacterized protein
MLPDIALFPLSAVLFPGGVMPLRIFEARYMDMVRNCMQQDRMFGVCLIVKGGEVGRAAEHEAVGCLAKIVDWDMQQLGLLNIRTIGTQRFRTLERRVQKDGLIRADIQPLAADPEVALPDDHSACGVLIRRLVEDLEKREDDPLKRMVASPYEFESAAWVSNRLCEFLPIPLRARQKLMELDDPLARLSLVHQFLQQRQAI